MSIFALKLEWLAQLQALYETGSVNQAALRCEMTAPALRHNLKLLEAYCGQTLLTATPQGLRLNAKGLDLLARSQALLSRLDALQCQFQQSEHIPRLLLAVSHSHPTQALPDALAQLYASFPGLQIETHFGTTQEVTRQVLRNQAELGLVTSPDLSDKRLSYALGMVSPGLYVKSGKHEVPEVYLLPLLWQYCASESVSYPKLAAAQVHYIGGVQCLIKLCLAGAGIGFVPRRYVETELENASLIQTEGPELPTQGPYQSRPTLIQRIDQDLSAPAARLYAWWKATYADA